MNEPKLMKKETITDKNIEKQKKLLVMAVICVVTLLISSSYALLTNFDKTDEVVNFQTGNLNMTINNTAGLINLNGNLPESDENGLLNATPITLTLTNTGTMKIEGYEVKLVSDETQTSTLNEDYIKYAISTDGTSYGSPSILTDTDNIIFNGYNLEVDASKTIYLKVWIDESAGNYALNKTYYGSIEVELYQKKDLPASEKVKIAIAANTDESCTPYVEEDGIIYFSGDNTCVDFNYVWYSGKLWRITAIYPDGTMKMITEDLITSISYGSDNKFYTDENTSSYMYQWLNQEFLPTLYNYENIIEKEAVWNASPGNETISTKLPVEGQEEVLVNASVGLLNSYEYYKSYQNTSYGSGYLNVGYYWWLLNPYSASSSYVWTVGSGLGYNNDPSYTSGVRPSIYLKSGVQIEGGKGTESEPYRIKGEQERAIANTTLLNTRQSGEYVNFNEELYRIVGIEDETTKLIKADYIKDESSTLIKKLASTTIFGKDTNAQSDDYWDYYLNNTWKSAIEDTYESMLVEGTYYTKYFTGGNYKETACVTVSNTTSIEDCDKTGVSTWSGYVGLPRYGEIFASQTRDSTSSGDNIWLITPSNSSTIWYLASDGGGGKINKASRVSARPTIHLKDTIVIKSGEGTKDKPFVVGLPS